MGNTYSPVGHLGGIEKIQEDADPFPRAVRAWISLMNSAAMYEALNETLYQKKMTLHRCLLSSSYSVQGTPQIAFKGMINTVEIKFADPARGNYLEVEVESRLKQSKLAAYYTNAIFHQHITSNSADSFLNFMHMIPTYVPAWGSKWVPGGIGGGGQTGAPSYGLPDGGTYGG
jgi:hypothetical protein